jgi:hypothetical protein
MRATPRPLAGCLNFLASSVRIRAAPNRPDIPAANTSLAGQERAIGNGKFGRKLAAKQMKVRRVEIVAKNHYVKGANAANRRHRSCLAERLQCGNQAAGRVFVQFLAHFMVFGRVEDPKALRDRSQRRISRGAGAGSAGHLRRAILGILEFGLRPATHTPFADTHIASDAPNATVNRRPWQHACCGMSNAKIAIMFRSHGAPAKG